MRNSEVLNQVNQARQPDHAFIKWWRREHDFLNFEMIDEFEDRAAHEEGIKWLEGFELLTPEQMWHELHHRFPDKVERQGRRTGEIIFWKSDGGEKHLPFNPQSLLEIFEAETGGDVID